MLTLNLIPEDIYTCAVARFRHGSWEERLELFTWLSGINFALMHSEPCSHYIERLNGRLFDIPADEFTVFAKDALEGLEWEGKC